MKKAFWVCAILTTLVILLPGCAALHKEYHFDGRINEEWVVFWEDSKPFVAYLEITKADGTKIKYTDYGGDLKLDSIRITPPGGIGGQRIYYYADSENPIVKETINDGQKKFESYLEKIHKINSAPLYDDKSK